MLKIKNKKDNITRNLNINLDNFSGTKTSSQKNFLTKNDKLPILHNKKFEYSLSTQNINLVRGNKIIDEIEEEINENNIKNKNKINKNYKNKNIKNIILLKEKENENIDKEKKDKNKNRNRKIKFENNNKTSVFSFKLKKINEMKNENFNKDNEDIQLYSERKEYSNDNNENIEGEKNVNDFEKEEEKNN